MALSDFEIIVGGVTSIPVVGGLVYLGFKIWGEKNLDTSKLKPKKAPAKNNADGSQKKTTVEKSEPKTKPSEVKQKSAQAANEIKAKPA